jgi:Spy/CpxP family protein refolding chaperone
VTELARVLNDLKTERAQAAVDDRRTTSALADAIGEDAWDEAKVSAAAEARVVTAKQLRDAVVKALGRIHSILEPAQRAKLAYLIRTGTLSI